MDLHTTKNVGFVDVKSSQFYFVRLTEKKMIVVMDKLNAT